MLHKVAQSSCYIYNSEGCIFPDKLHIIVFVCWNLRRQKSAAAVAKNGMKSWRERLHGSKFRQLLISFRSGQFLLLLPEITSSFPWESLDRREFWALGIFAKKIYYRPPFPCGRKCRTIRSAFTSLESKKFSRPLPNIASSSSWQGLVLLQRENFPLKKKTTA